MKYYLDQEFHEGFRKPISWLPTIGRFNRPHHFIDLISIGIVCEDGREYYAVSKDFDLKSAYYKHEVIPFLTSKNHSLNNRREYWLRDNVLSPIFYSFYKPNLVNLHHTDTMTYGRMKSVIKELGKFNIQIAKEIVDFIYPNALYYNRDCLPSQIGDTGAEQPEFYGYYADYDWVLFCSLYGTMIDLPKGFPMYCRDLKQMLDEKAITLPWDSDGGLSAILDALKKEPDYPRQENEHHALSDAKWNRKLHKFILSLTK